MVTFRPYGRLGNFLFECATAYAFSLRHGLDFTVPHSTDNEEKNPVYLKHLINPKYDPTLTEAQIFEITHNYRELRFDESYRNRNVKILGYRQSEKYFSEFRDEILEAFAFPYDKLSGVVSIHVRRGDYVDLAEFHPPVTEEYINKAIEHFYSLGYTKFLFHSDDIDWCIDMVKELHGVVRFYYSKNKSPIDDLISMSCCEHQICSNSTLAWWGWWLNRNEEKICIMPQVWFGEKLNKETKDIYPKNCIKL